MSQHMREQSIRFCPVDSEVESEVESEVQQQPQQHQQRQAEDIQTCQSAVPALRPLRDGYCAAYRRSLTDSKIRSGSFAYMDQYALVPPSHPKARPWLTLKNVEELHLEHQIWCQDQGWLCFQRTSDPSATDWDTRVPRLGMQLTVKDLDGVEPSNLRWSGKVSLELKVAMKETLGIDEREVSRGNLASVWPWPENNVQSGVEDSEFDFLSKVFGVQFYNLITADQDCEPKLSGPKSFSELDCNDGILSGSWLLQGMFYCPVDLQNFPCEVCCWDAIVSVIGWSPGVTYDWSTLRNFNEFEIFGLHGLARASDDMWCPYVCEQNVVPNLARRNENMVYCRFHSRRKAQSVMTNIVMPIGLVTLLSTIAIMQASGLKGNDVAMGSADPLSFLATSLLTVVAMKFAFVDMLPKGLGQPTLLDNYISSCILLLAFSMFCTVCVSVEDLGDFQAPLIYAGLVALIHLTFGCAAVWGSMVPIARRGDKLYTLPHESEDAKSELPIRIGFIEDVAECMKVLKCLTTASEPFQF
ncbi:unnamed protein product [Polarella glacialis]|uniref:Uncharacterized protein n=1 Tax=Polarella glacialis TaxID=89957 RepID=A0A813GU70_POLGL|nr:unnamed protein product [Polarella glacialis]CAE8675643.1 unnamed protein product [Polarella glacialis]